MMKRFLIPLLAALCVLSLVCAAQAEGDPVRVSMTISENRFTGPGETIVTIRVENTGPSALAAVAAMAMGFTRWA